MAGGADGCQALQDEGLHPCGVQFLRWNHQFFKGYVQELLKKVNEALDGLTYDRKPSSLYEPIKYVLAIGGKRVRPVLMLLAYNLFKDDPLRIMTQALGLETYHNFTLLHDDLMDNADWRPITTSPCCTTT